MDSPRPQPGHPFRFPRRHRLKSHTEIRRVLRDEFSLRRRFGAFSVSWAASSHDTCDPRFAFVVSRAHGSAVARNRIKRRLREAVRTNRHHWPFSCVQIVIRPHSESAAALSFEKLQLQMREALELIAGHRA